jgi:3-deoxy-D-manno-octulosonic-acid transferase
MGFFMRGVYGGVSHFAMQSEASAERAVLLGAARDRVTVCGNTKYDIDAHQISGNADVLALGEVLGLGDSTLIIAGSTTDGEEALVLDAFRQLKSLHYESARLLLAPRHPERFDQVAQQIELGGFKFIRRTMLDVNRHREEPSKAEVVLLDSVGELTTLFRFARAVFIGGSLVPRGGHNILEPASHGKPIIVGPYMDNFEEITSEFLARDAVVQLKQAEPHQLTTDLTEAIRSILDDSNRARRLGDNALAVLNGQRGASLRIVSLIGELLSSRTQHQ